MQGEAARTILLVEDEALIAAEEARQLRDRGYRVIPVSTGEKAIEIVRDPPGRIDLILRIGLRRRGESAEFNVDDDGPGLPEHIDPLLAESMGMSLVRMLTEQLEGTLTFKKGNGTRALCRFSL